MFNNAVTFENIDKRVEGSDLINNNFHESKDFLELYYSMHKKLPKPDEKQKQYLSWHKEFGNDLFDKVTKSFKKTNLKDKALFIKTHPLLTLKDNKNLSLLKINISEIYKKLFIVEFLTSSLLFLTYIRFRYGRGKFKEYYIKNRLKVTCLILINVFAFDIVFNAKLKHMYMDKLLEEKGMKKRYFDEYLI
jgi:hypothetical protein